VKWKLNVWNWPWLVYRSVLPCTCSTGTQKPRENSPNGQFDSGQRPELQTFQIRSSNVVHSTAIIRLASCSFFFFSLPNVLLISKCTNILNIWSAIRHKHTNHVTLQHLDTDSLHLPHVVKLVTKFGRCN